ncbi:MAG: DUF1360 domain-containing protein [Patescibacteria group bacterium]|nr:DUF1360 domain-containing protein [Patescibacteria group bacterium]
MKFHFWYVMFSVFYLALAVSGYLWLADNSRLTLAISLADFSLVALATMRLIRLFTRDAITEFIRNWFVGADEESFLGTLGTLINCPWCSGLWFATAVTFFYFATPIAWYAILVLALASVASLLQIFANFIGWSTEVKKKQAQM